ncbi:MAG: T9SS type A sorting domain-containing protein [Lentimicrobium sp.]
MKLLRHLSVSLLMCFSLVSAYAQYCIPQYINDPYIGISDVQVNSLINYDTQFNDAGYVLYPPVVFSTYLTIGQNYPLQLSSTGPDYGSFSLWIDLNDDFTFSEDELMFHAEGSNLVSSMLSIPDNSDFIGPKRMRIMYNVVEGAIFPCGWQYASGETEDYTIQITDSLVTPVYCIPITGNSAGFSIQHFKLNTLFNCGSEYPSGGYTLYPDSLYTTTLRTGNTYPFYISNGATTAGIYGNFAVYLDYNNNYEFDAEEKIYEVTDVRSTYGYITIPADTTLSGNHRLRVRSAWHEENLEGCQYAGTGETEDYTITIVPGDSLTAPPDNLWEFTYDFPTNQRGLGILESYDKGYIINSVTGTNSDEPFIVKTSFNGDTLWTKAFPSSHFYHPMGMDTTTDGGLALCGWTTESNEYGGSYIMKLDACGDKEWLKFYCSMDHSNETAEVLQLPDGGYIATTIYFSDDAVTQTDNLIGLLRIDSVGNTLWSKDYTRYHESGMGRLLLTSDHGYLISGWGYLPEPSDSTGSFHLRSILTKIDSAGILDWRSIHGTTGDIYCYAFASVEVTGKGYLSIGGIIDNLSDPFVLSVISTSYNGSIRWTKPLTSDEFNRYNPVEIERVNDNLYAILTDRYDDCDNFGYKAAVFMIDSLGNVMHNGVFGDIINQSGSLCTTTDGKLMVTSTGLATGNTTIYTLKLNYDLSIDTVSLTTLIYDSICDAITAVPEIKKTDKMVVSVYPNPTEQNTMLKLEEYDGLPYDVTLYNSSGIILKEYLNCSTGEVQLYFQNKKAGLYFARVVTGGSVYTVRIILAR